MIVQGNGSLQPISSNEYVVSHSFVITGLGTAVAFEGDPPIVLPLGPGRAAVRTPGGRRFEMDVSVEALLVAGGGPEALALLFGELKPEDVPPGSVIRLLDR